jgi:hypothetical protein
MAKKILLKQIGEYQYLYRDPKTGIAWVENGSTGMGHTCHPSIHYTGSVSGMKKLGYWRKEDRTVRSHGWIYNIDSLVVDDAFDEIARQYCQCGGKHERKG